MTWGFVPSHRSPAYPGGVNPSHIRERLPLIIFSWWALTSFAFARGFVRVHTRISLSVSRSLFAPGFHTMKHVPYARARKRLGVAAWVCTRVFVDDEEGRPTGGADRWQQRRQWRGKGEPPSLRRRSSLSVNTGYVGRRAGLNWHQLPAKHPPRTFSPPAVFLPALRKRSRPTLLTPARSPQRREERPPLRREPQRYYIMKIHIYTQLTWLVAG